MEQYHPTAPEEVDEASYRLLVDAVTDYAIYMLDPNGHVVSWNPGARRFKGYENWEILGEHFSRFYTEEDRQEGLPKKALETAAREGRFENEGWRVRKDGTRFWAHVVVDAIRDTATGELRGFAKITRDVTERMQSQQALEEAREQLLQSQKMEAIGQLTGGIAHDFNNLLMAILASLELMRKRLPDEPSLMRLLENATEGAQRGVSLTQRMLAFARRQPIDPKPVDVPGVVRNLVEFLQPTLGGDPIETRIPASLPPVRADSQQLELALLNLALNARDAMPEGRSVVIEAQEENLSETTEGVLPPGRYVCLSVIDTGEGMDEETLQRAREPFFTTKGRGKGTGMGLPATHGIVEQIQGRLVLKSKKGQGTTAQIWIPLADLAAEEAVAEQTVEHRQSLQAADRPLKVLAVDDDALVLMNMAAMLEDLGHIPVEATSGEKALELLKQDAEIDLVVTDQAMPRMTGLELAEVIKRERPELPVVLATGYAELPPEADGTLPRLDKPFFEQDLAQAIDGVRQKSRD